MDDPRALTWSELVRLEPRVGQLRLDCRFADHGDPNGFNRELAWEGSPGVSGLKERLDSLLGEKADTEDPILRSNQAYQIASEECHQALPPNRTGIGISVS
jgi:hypothetical protein